MTYNRGRACDRERVKMGMDKTEKRVVQEDVSRETRIVVFVLDKLDPHTRMHSHVRTHMHTRMHKRTITAARCGDSACQRSLSQSVSSAAEKVRHARWATG